MYDVITLGSATIDVFPVISKKLHDVKLGEKVLVDKIAFETGGGGVNSAAGLSRMGLKTAFLGKLGHDHNAFKILHELKKEKVSVIKTDASEYPTSYSVIMNSSLERDRIIFTYKGASDHLRYSEIKKSSLNTKWMYMATMLGESLKTCKKLAKFASKNNIKIMFNPSTYLAKKGKLALRPILNATTILVLNKEEAKLLLKTKKNYIPYLLQELRRLGPKVVVVTEGNKGVAVFDGTNIYSMKAYDVKVMSTAGAGDAFASGFLAGILHKKDIAHALELGMANASSVVQYFGTKNKLLTYRQALKFISKRKENVLMRKL